MIEKNIGNINEDRTGKVRQVLYRNRKKKIECPIVEQGVRSRLLSNRSKIIICKWN